MGNIEVNKKDEALKKCLRVLNPIANEKVYESQWVNSAIHACLEALEEKEEPQHLYVYEHNNYSKDIWLTFDKNPKVSEECEYIGKIKLEAEE